MNCPLLLLNLYKLQIKISFLEMTFIKNFKTGILKYREALLFIHNNKLNYFFIFPLLLNIVLFYFGWTSINSLSNYSREYIESISHINTANFWGHEFIQTLIDIILYIFFKILFILIFAYTGGYIIIILLSPIFSILSEKVEKIQTGKQYSFNLATTINDIITGIYISVRNLCYELLITIVLIFFSFIPIIGWFSIIILFLVSSYFYGFSFYYYSIERKGLGKAQNIKFMKNNKNLLISNGFIFASCLMIPFIGILLSSFVAIISVVAASISINEEIKLKNQL